MFNRKKLVAYDPLYQIPFNAGDDVETDPDAPVPQSVIFDAWIDDEEMQKKLGRKTAKVIIHFGITPRSWRPKSGKAWSKWGETESSNDPVNIVQRRIQGGTSQYGGNSWWDSREFISIFHCKNNIFRDNYSNFFVLFVILIIYPNFSIEVLLSVYVISFSYVTLTTEMRTAIFVCMVACNFFYSNTKLKIWCPYSSTYIIIHEPYF